MGGRRERHEMATGGHRARVEEALSRWGSTRTDVWIGNRLGLSPRTVANWRLRLGIWKTRTSWYTTGEAARVTGLSPQAWSRLARTGQVRARRLKAYPRAHHAWWLIAPEEVEHLLRRRCPQTWERWLRERSP